MGWIRSEAPGRTPERATRSTSGAASGGPGEDSLIAAGMVLKGDCRTEGPLRVDGRVTGDVHASRLVVGPGGHVGGSVTGDGGGSADHTVVIEGRVDGAVSAPRVEIGKGGAVGGGMKVRDAVVRGRVAGGIRTEGRLLLEATAIVEGDVAAHRLGLTEGGQVFGTIRIGERPSGAPDTQPSAARETRDGG